jgi:hypothetical protein
LPVALVALAGAIISDEPKVEETAFSADTFDGRPSGEPSLCQLPWSGSCMILKETHQRPRRPIGRVLVVSQWDVDPVIDLLVDRGGSR